MFQTRYIRPKSLTWWAGAVLIVLGLFNPFEAIGMVVMGVGLIGLRDAIERQRDEVREYVEEILGLTGFDDPDGDGDFAGLFGDDEFDRNAHLPDGESELPEGVIDPFGPGGSRS